MSDTAEMVQFNIRMPRELRDAGNAALASEGITPSAYVRAVWDRLARRGRDLQEMLSLVEPVRSHRVSVGQDVAQDADVSASMTSEWAAGEQLRSQLAAYLGEDFPRAVRAVRQTPSEELEDAIFEHYLIKEGVLEPTEALATYRGEAYPHA